MTWQLTLVAVWIQFAVGAAVILGMTSLALRWIAQPAERARLIQFMLAAVLVAPFLSALTPFPSWNLGLLSRDTIASVPEGEAAIVEHDADFSANAEGSVAPVSLQRDTVSQSGVRDNLAASRDELPASVPSPPSILSLRIPSIDAGWMLALAIVLAHVAAAIYILAQWTIGSTRLRRLCRAASEAAEPVHRAWQTIAGNRAQRVRLLVSTEVEAPLMFGWLWPVVVIPHEIAAKNDSALACCLAHEWSHIERADILSWRFVNFCQFVLWYQPAYWTLRRELRICQEFLADNRSASGAVGSVEYSELLLGLAKRRRALGVVGALTMFDQPSQLARRIKMLLEDHVPLSARCRRPFTWCVLAVSALLVVTISAVRIDAIQADEETPEPVAPSAAKAIERGVDEKPSAHMVSYTELTTMEGQAQTMKTREFSADDGRKRTELSSGITTICDATGFSRITLIDRTKTAMVRQPVEGQRRFSMKPFMEWFQSLKKTSSEPVKQLGQKQLEGKLVNGLVATHGGLTYTIWEDRDTGEPVRIEYDLRVSGAAAHKVLTDFRFGEKLDESLFRFDVPTGYKVWQAPAVTSAPGGKEKPSAGALADLEPAWSRDGQWVAVAAIEGQAAVYGVYRLQSVVELNERGEDFATTKIINAAFKIRAANLSGVQGSEFLTMFNSSPVTAYSSDEKVLWYYSQEGVPGDVCATDLNHDGFDEVILSYTGFGGLQALDHTGKLLWKDTSLGNVWSVSAGNLEGDALPEIVAVDGKVHVFDAQGTRLRDFDPGFNVNTVRVWESADKDQSAALIAVAGTDASNKTTVAALNPKGATQWSFDLPARVANAAACRQKPWLAVTLANGNVRVIDVVAGREIAQVGGQGERADVAWMPTKEGAPLLIVASGEALHAYRVPAARPSK